MHKPYANAAGFLIKSNRAALRRTLFRYLDARREKMDLLECGIRVACIAPLVSAGGVSASACLLLVSSKRMRETGIRYLVRRHPGRQNRWRVLHQRLP